jgi:hypothetical protein
MRDIKLSCDITDGRHGGRVEETNLDVIFDHDQEDGKSRTRPYFQREKMDICESCLEFLMGARRYVYGYGAMGYNKYYLHKTGDK